MATVQLYSTTFLAYRGRGQFCARCLMLDHAQEDCALNSHRVLPLVQFRDLGAGPSRREEYEPRHQLSRGACFAFNNGKCSSPCCRFDHVCTRCGGNHRKSSCRSRPRGDLKEERSGICNQEAATSLEQNKWLVFFLCDSWSQEDTSSVISNIILHL